MFEGRDPALGDLVYEVLCGLPGSVSMLLRQVHSLPFIETDVARMDGVSAVHAWICQDDAKEWVTRDDFAQAIFHTVLDNYLCGFSADKISSEYVQEDVTNYITDILNILQEWLHILGHVDSRQAPQYLEWCFEQVTEVWSRIWDVRMTLLDPSRLPCDDGQLYTTLEYLASADADLQLSQRRDIQLFFCHSWALHVLHHIWFSAIHHAHRFNAFDAVKRILDKGQDKSNTPLWRTFCSQTPLSPLQLAKAFWREFKDFGDITSHEFSQWISSYIIIRDNTIRKPMTPAADHRLLQAVLDMCCYQSCSVEDRDGHGVIPLLVMTYFNSYFRYSWGREPRSSVVLAEQDIFLILFAIGQPLIHVMINYDTVRDGHIFTNALSEMRQLMTICTNKLENGRNSLTGQLDNEKRKRLQFTCSRVHWAPLLREMRRSRIQGNAFLRRITDVYDRFGQALGLHTPAASIPAEEPRLWVPGADRYCNYQGCLCNAHKLGHRMMVCSGCRQVLYCGVRCQASDWKRGHRVLCRTLVQE